MHSLILLTSQSFPTPRLQSLLKIPSPSIPIEAPRQKLDNSENPTHNRSHTHSEESYTMSAWLPAQEITETYRVTEATLAHFSQRGNLPARGLTSTTPRYSLAHVERLFPKRVAEPTIQMIPPKLGLSRLGGIPVDQGHTHAKKDPATYYLAAS